MTPWLKILLWFFVILGLKLEIFNMSCRTSVTTPLHAFCSSCHFPHHFQWPSHLGLFLLISSFTTEPLLLSLAGSGPPHHLTSFACYFYFPLSTSCRSYVPRDSVSAYQVSVKSPAKLFSNTLHFSIYFITLVFSYKTLRGGLWLTSS